MFAINASSTVAARSGRLALGSLCLTFLLQAQFTPAPDGGGGAMDPPSRVARLNLIDGAAVSMQPAGSDQWVPAILNRPFTIGDYIYADNGSRAELEFDGGVLRIGPYTSFGFLNFDDHTAQIRLVEGALNVWVRRLDPGQVVEVDTPNAAINILAPGDYRINVNPNDQTSYVVVRSGSADISGGGAGFTIEGGEGAQLWGEDVLGYNRGGVPDPDDFDRFCFSRDQREGQVRSRYLPPEMIGGEDLDRSGVWSEEPGYGAVWYPPVSPGWAPYHYGHWAWIEPWGWTWVDDAPWGFAPFHYGRWAYIGSRWGWTPGPMVVGYGRYGGIRPVYAPALVAFIGAGAFSVGFSVGGPALGWVALGPGEFYSPAYRVSPGYFRQVNVSNTVINNNVNITNVYNNTYVNRGGAPGGIVSNRQQFANMQAPNAVSVMSQSAFASGQPVSRAGQIVQRQQLASVQNARTVVAPPVAPTRQALMSGQGMSAPRPAPQLLSRPVFAKSAPPPPPASFESKRQYLATSAGQPFSQQALHATLPPNPAAPSFRRAGPGAGSGQSGTPNGAFNTQTNAVPGGNRSTFSQGTNNAAGTGNPGNAGQTRGVPPNLRPVNPNAPAFNNPASGGTTSGNPGNAGGTGAGGTQTDPRFRRVNPTVPAGNQSGASAGAGSGQGNTPSQPQFRRPTTTPPPPPNLSNTTRTGGSGGGATNTKPAAKTVKSEPKEKERER